MTDERVQAVVARLRSAGCVFAEDEAALLVEAADAELDRLVAERVAGRPLEHLLGWAGFAGRRLVVADGVFVPRRRTELLARKAVQFAAESPATRPVVVDLCCGCGAVASVVAELGVELHAADISARALECARANLGEKAQLYLGDLFGALPSTLAGRVDVLVANAPYVPTDEISSMPAEAREHEPAVALDGGSDGLDVMRRIVAQAAFWLAPGGRLLIETSMEQSGRAGEIFGEGGLRFELVHSDDVDGTVVVGWF